MLRIEISYGGLGTPVLDFQTALSSFISDADSVISSFKTVRNSTYSLNGGVGDLQGSLDSIDTRIQAEEAKKSAAEKVQTKANDFLQLAERVDRQVAGYVNQNKEELYSVNPWLRPATSVSEDAPWYEKAWNWLCEKGEAITGAVKSAWEWTKDTAIKAWNGAVAFYNEHKNLCNVLIGVAAIVVAVIVTVATGGAALPALLAMTKAALTAGLISAAIGGGVSLVSSLLSGAATDALLDNMLDATIDGFCTGFMWGGIFAAGSQILVSIRSAPVKHGAYPKQEGGKYSDLKKLADGDFENVHHMPANSVNGLSPSQGSSIIMDAEDHTLTASFNNKPGSTAFRLQQKKLIESGRYMDAFEMDVDNLHALFGSKYDVAIEKAEKYVLSLIEKGVVK